MTVRNGPICTFRLRLAQEGRTTVTTSLHMSRPSRSRVLQNRAHQAHGQWRGCGPGRRWMGAPLDWSTPLVADFGPGPKACVEVGVMLGKGFAADRGFPARESAAPGSLAVLDWRTRRGTLLHRGFSAPFRVANDWP